MAESIVAAGQHALRVAAAQQLPGVANGVAAGSAGIGDDRDGSVKAKSIRQIQPLPLRLIVHDSSCLPAIRVRGRYRLPVIILPQAHAAAGCAEYDRQILGGLPT